MKKERGERKFRWLKEEEEEEGEGEAKAEGDERGN